MTYTEAQKFQAFYWITHPVIPPYDNASLNAGRQYLEA